jgi:hypothetical protein
MIGGERDNDVAGIPDSVERVQKNTKGTIQTKDLIVDFA